jgi:hypothetical protein
VIAKCRMETGKTFTAFRCEDGRQKPQSIVARFRGSARFYSIGIFPRPNEILSQDDEQYVGLHFLGKPTGAAATDSALRKVAQNSGQGFVAPAWHSKK